MGPPERYWSRCNEKLSSIIKSTSLSLLLTTLIFLSVSPAPAPEARRCYWCGPLAEQVHRSRRAKPCSAPLQETVCEEPYRYCAIVAVTSPHTESRLCVKKYTDECYPLYCNTTRSYKMTCPCRGDLCNGPNTLREEAAFQQLRQLTASLKHKRSIEPMLSTTPSPTPQSENSIDISSTTEQNRQNDQHYHSGNAGRGDYENIDTTTAVVNALGSREDIEVNGNSSNTHEAIVNESEPDNRVDNDKQKVQTKTETGHSEISTRYTVETTSQTEHVTNFDKTTDVTQTFKIITDDSNTSTTELNEISTKYHKTMTEANGINEISNLEDPAKPTTIMVNMGATSEYSLDCEVSHLDNEISKDLGVASTEVPSDKNANFNKTDNNEVIGTPNPNEIIDDNKKPDKEVDDRLNIGEKHDPGINMETTTNYASDFSITTELLNFNSVESNTLLSQEAPKPSPSDITITKLPERDTNDIGSHGIEILNQKIENTTDTVDSNYEDTCNAGTCKASGPSIDQSENNELINTQVNTTPPADVTTPKTTLHPEEIDAKGSIDNEKNPIKGAMSTVSNKDKLADPFTTVSTALQSKLGPTTELTTLGNKKSMQTKGKNGVFSLSGCILLITNAFLIGIAL